MSGRDLNSLQYDFYRRHTRDLAPASLSAVTTGTSPVLEFAGLSSGVSIYVEWSSGVSAGVVVVETARSAAYAGTWHVLGTFNFDAGKVVFSRVAGAFLAVRARLTTNVVGGTVSVTVVKES